MPRGFSAAFSAAFYHRTADPFPAGYGRRRPSTLVRM